MVMSVGLYALDIPGFKPLSAKPDTVLRHYADQCHSGSRSTFSNGLRTKAVSTAEAAAVIQDIAIHHFAQLGPHGATGYATQ